MHTPSDSTSRTSSSLGALATRTGRGVRVAVIDSGVNVAHPHITRIAGGVTVGEEVEEGVYLDLLGHGTAVMAAIQEKAPGAEYFAVRVFYSTLTTNIDYLLRAIEWCVEKRVHIINLSLGTTNPAHVRRLSMAVAAAAKVGTIIVSAREANSTRSLPGTLPGVIGVGLDWDCPRETYHSRTTPAGLEWCTSGYPRDLPGMPRERNLHGVSFAVANITGFAACACEGLEERTYRSVCSVLTGFSMI